MSQHVSFDLLFKATPATEGDQRLIYFEASNEGVDQQGERVLAKALAESAAIFKAHGNIDIDHLSLLRKGRPEGIESEIGFPLDAVVDDRRTFVKAQLYAGDTPLARNANMVWESLTKLSPPARWYPSVGGSVLSKSVQVDPATKSKVTVVDKVRWTNVALSRTPVNQHVGTASASPVGVFCKALGAFVFDDPLEKALEAGYGTDSANLTGGGALRGQSLHGAPVDYFDFCEHVAAAIKRLPRPHVIAGRDGNFSDVKVLKSIADYASSTLSMPLGDAMVFTERFLSDLQRRTSHEF